MSLKEKIKNLESKYLLIEAQIRQETNTEKLDKLKKGIEEAQGKLAEKEHLASLFKMHGKRSEEHTSELQSH